MLIFFLKITIKQLIIIIKKRRLASPFNYIIKTYVTSSEFPWQHR